MCSHRVPRRGCEEQLGRPWSWHSAFALMHRPRVLLCPLLLAGPAACAWCGCTTSPGLSTLLRTPGATRTMRLVSGSLWLAFALFALLVRRRCAAVRWAALRAFGFSPGSTNLTWSRFPHPVPPCAGDQSRNNWWVGLLGFGEGWHNNHHAFEFSARHGLEVRAVGSCKRLDIVMHGAGSCRV